MDILKNIINFFKREDSPALMKEEHMFCPCCKDKILLWREISDIKFHYCPDCSGAFMTQKDINYFINNNQEDSSCEIYEKHSTAEHTFNRSKESRKCPLCSEKMDNMQFQYSSGIWVDYCQSGHGIWFDGGEVKLIREYILQREDFYKRVDEKLHDRVTEELYNYLVKHAPYRISSYRKRAIEEYALYFHSLGSEAKIEKTKYSLRVDINVPEDFLCHKIVSYAIEDRLIPEKVIEEIKKDLE